MVQKSLNDILKELYPALRRKTEEIESSVDSFFHDQAPFLIFLSATDGKDRARVVTGRAATFRESWEIATKKLRKMLLTNRIKPNWVKADLVTSIETVPFQLFLTRMARLKRNFYRLGISFDRQFNCAFMEQEVNANVFFENWENEHVTMSTRHIHYYMREYREMNQQINLNKLHEIHMFDTKSVFYDEAGLHYQRNGLLNKGSRDIKVNGTNIASIIQQGTEYLGRSVLKDGRFNYVQYPAFDKSLLDYHIAHHAQAVYTMLEAYEVTQQAELKDGIDCSLNYLLEKSAVTYTLEGKVCTFISNDRTEELDLSATAFTLLSMIKYRQLFSVDTYDEYLKASKNAILHFQQPDGRFKHVLEKDGTPKSDEISKFYEGQAVLALLQLYVLTQNQTVLYSVERSFRYFIRNHYDRYGDPWLNSAAIYLFQFKPNIDYAEFNLKMSERMLTTAFTDETTHTHFVEIFMSTHFLLMLLKENQIESEVIQQFDEEKFYRALNYRLHYQLNSYIWPEMAMYFKSPEKVHKGFFKREQFYEIRIDYIASQLTGLIHYYNELKKFNAMPIISTQELVENEKIMEGVVYGRTKRWDKAVQSYESVLDNAATWLPFTSAAYVEALILNGQMNEAYKVLMSAKEKSPEHKDILYALLGYYEYQGEYTKAFQVINKLIKTNAENEEYYFRLGRILSVLGEFTDAKSAYKVGLIHKHHLSTEELIKKVTDGFPGEITSVVSYYDFFGGQYNYGVIIHEDERSQEKYITKISEMTGPAIQESLFYQSVIAEFTILQEIVPTFIDSRVWDGIQYLTIEMIEEKKHSKMVFEKLLPVYEIISASDYSKLVEGFPNNNYILQLKPNVLTSVTRFFSSIHQEEQNVLLFNALQIYTSQAEYLKPLQPIVEDLKEQILHKQLYTQVIPETHYSLLHGDLSNSNLIVNSQTNELNVLDWGSFLIGPRYMDIVHFVVENNLSFGSVKEQFLLNDELQKPLDQIEQLFFCFAYIVMHMIRISEENSDVIIRTFITPAKNYLDELMRGM